MINKKVILLILVLTIVVVILRELFDVYQCIDSKGTWNPKTKVCEANIKGK